MLSSFLLILIFEACLANCDSVVFPIFFITQQRYYLFFFIKNAS